MNWQSGDCWSNAVKDTNLNPNCDTKMAAAVNTDPSSGAAVASTSCHAGVSSHPASYGDLAGAAAYDNSSCGGHNSGAGPAVGEAAPGPSGNNEGHFMANMLAMENQQRQQQQQQQQLQNQH